MSPELDALTRVVSPVLLGACVWFLKRAVGSIDKVATTVEAHTVTLAQHAVQISTLQGDVSALRLQVNDLGGFLRDAGFRKRDDAKE
jgi:hypothetical protein